MAEQAVSQHCEADNCKRQRHVPLFFCSNCDSTYCNNCWEAQGPHKPGKLGADGLEHEKVEPIVYQRLKPILHPPCDEELLLRLHEEDEDTTWFGIEKDANGQPIFQDHGRYAALMAETRQPGAMTRYPQLVSFVGQTGAGKSTLIKMLVLLRERNLQLGSDVNFKSPVVGSARNDKSPTSGDVHLYIDPETAYGPLPLLYADCEGLDGGETAPVAKRMRRTMRNQNQAPSLGRRLFSTRPRELVYAKANSEARNREWAVRKVYPRLLYTFSDVVVFVLRNARAFESSALKLLIEWASTSLESSVNQPALPHAIIVLNATPLDIDQEEWDPKVATERLMAHVAEAVVQVDFFRRYAEHWRKRHRTIDNMLDLIRCYYANITVIRVPMKGRYMLIDGQINKLHAEIVKDCDGSFSSKDGAHMLSNADELNSYLQAGFDHFTTEEDKPFNFVEVALKNNPIPLDFGDHILGLAANVREVTKQGDGKRLFRNLSFIVASCIFIDCIRKHRPGKSQDLFDSFYSVSCIASLEHFCDKFWPCNYVSKKGKACVNFKSTHKTKGHQNANGKVISTGPYQSEFSSYSYTKTWTTAIKENLNLFEMQLEMIASQQLPKPHSGNESKFQLAHTLHLKNMHIFFNLWESYNARSFASPTTCYCCLMEVPQHPLQCGHVLCAECVKVYGKPNDSNSFVMVFCPLHQSDSKFLNPWIIHFKPNFVGTRLLSLDGGGMRGIIELEVLREVEEALGGKIPLLAFFDLIVGTSTGCIIALGLGVKQWSLRQCIVEFTRLCDQAFTPRELQTPGLQQVTTLRHGSKYKTRPLRNALKSVFGDEDLYGGPKKGHTSYDTKVAVTTTSGTGARAIVLANYSRQEENEPSYHFEFPHRLRVWEAASATSAAPPFFKPFEAEDRRTYLDGAIYYNNPVRVADHERRYIWPDVADNPPDIILSIGTGKNGSAIAEQLRNEKIDQTTVRKSKPKSANKWKAFGERLTPKLKKPRHFQLIHKYFDVLVNRIDKILDAEREWEIFSSEIQVSGKGKDASLRCIRFNLDLDDDPPPLDAKNELTNLQSRALALLKTFENRAIIETIAHRLIASTFYFIKDSVRSASGLFYCLGRIACRFEGNSSEMNNNMRELGNLLRQQQSSNYQPYFTVKEQYDHPDTKKVPISEAMIEDMVRRAQFMFQDTLRIEIPTQLTPTTIYLALCSRWNNIPVLYPISGFPRGLVMEDAINATRLDKRAELIRERRHVALDVAKDLKAYGASDESLQKVNSAESGLDGATLADESIASSSDHNVSRAKSADNPAQVSSQLRSGSIKKSSISLPVRAEKVTDRAERKSLLSGWSSSDSSGKVQPFKSARSPIRAPQRSQSMDLRRRPALDSLRANAHVVTGTPVVDANTLSSISDYQPVSVHTESSSDEPMSNDGDV